MSIEPRSKVHITVQYNGRDVYTGSSINEITEDEMHLLMPELLKDVTSWAKNAVKARLEQIQNPAYAYQQTQLPSDSEDAA